jgi:hypothetical protein
MPTKTGCGLRRLDADNVLWVSFSLAFRLYVTRVGDYAATYGRSLARRYYCCGCISPGSHC